MPGETNFIKRQEGPKKGLRDVSPLLIADIEARNKHGLEKYGRRLQTFNGRDAFIDLYEELVDAAQYVRQVVEEDLYGVLRRIRDKLATAELECEIGTKRRIQSILNECLDELKRIPNLDKSKPPIRPVSLENQCECQHCLDDRSRYGESDV
jgi:hypothetical protein